MDDQNHDPQRRATLAALATGGAIFLSGCNAAAEAAKSPSTSAAGAAPSASARSTLASFAQPRGAHAVKPLPFVATKLPGLSEKLLVSHHDNNYASAVKNLNKAEEELTRVTKDTPPFVVGALQERALGFRNSATLHELYFENLGGDGVPHGAVDTWMSEGFGSRAKWEESFRQVAASLGGGSGWVLLAHDLRRDGLVLGWSGNHSQVVALGAPVLVLDMYEHAYQMDYGAAAAKYVDAFFANLAWDVVDVRFARARRAAAALRGESI